MALPATIGGTTSDLWWAGRSAAGQTGPWHYDGAVFGAFRDMTNNTIEVWYSTATVSSTTTYSRGELWQEADSAGHPTGNTDTSIKHYAKAPSGIVVNNFVWLFYLDDSSQIEASSFDLINRTWGTTVSGAVTVTPYNLSDSGGWNTNSIAPVRVDDSTVRVFHNIGTLIGTATKTQFLPYYADLDISAGTWGTSIILDSSTNTQHDFMVAYALEGKSGMSHFFYNEHIVSPTGDAILGGIGQRHISVTSDGTIGTAQVLRSDTIVQFGWHRQGVSIYDPDLDEYRLMMPIRDGTQAGSGGNPATTFKPSFVYSTSEAQPTWGTRTVWDGNAWMENEGGLAFVCPNDLERLWLLWGGRDNTNGNSTKLFLAKTDLSTSTEPLEGTSTSLVSTINTFHRGVRPLRVGSNIGYLYSKVTDPPPSDTHTFQNFYDEVEIDFCVDCCPEAASGGGNYAYLS